MEWVHHDGAEACSPLVRPHILTKKNDIFPFFSAKKRNAYTAVFWYPRPRAVCWMIYWHTAKCASKNRSQGCYAGYIGYAVMLVMLDDSNLFLKLFSVNTKLPSCWSRFFLFAEQNHYHFEALCKSCNLQLQNLWETSSKTQQNQWKQSTWNPFTLHLLTHVVLEFLNMLPMVLS